MGDVVLETPRQAVGDLRIEHGQVDLIVDSERSVVEVGRPDDAPLAVDDGNLGVDHGGLIFVEFDSDFQQVTIGAAPGTAGQGMVGVFARNNNFHLNSAFLSVCNSGTHAAVR